MRKSRLSIAFGALLAATLVAGAAQADTTAWSTASANLPSDTAFVIGFNMATIGKSQSWQMFWTAATSQSADFKTFADTVKSTCKIDVSTAVGTVVIGMADNQKDGAMYVQLNGIDEPKFTKCLGDVLKAMKGKTVKSMKSGNVVTYSGGDKTLYVGWPATNVLAISFQKQDDKATLDHWMGKGGAISSDLSKAAASANPNAALWGATAKSTPIPNVGTLKSGYGWLDIDAKDNVNIEGHMIMSSASEASAVVTQANQGISQMSSQLPQVAKAIAVTSSGADVKMTFSMPEKDIIALVQQFVPALKGAGSATTPGNAGKGKGKGKGRVKHGM